MAKKILVFSIAYYPDAVGGAEVAIKEITDRISPDEVTFEMLTLLFDPQQPREEKIGNVLVHRIGVGSKYLSKILFIPLAALTAVRMHRTRPFDGLWAMMTYMLFPVVLARMIGLRTPYVLTLQDGDPYETVFERWFIRPVTPLLDYGLRHATVIQAISSYLATWPMKRGSKVPIEIVYNGSNPRDFTNTLTQEELEAYKKKVGKKDGDVYLVTTSRLVHKNAVDDVIKALPLLPSHVHFLVVGGGPDEDALKSLTKELGVADRVIFTGQVERTETPKYRRISDIFVRPSRSEGLGNSFASAMASDLPIIATQEGGIAEFLFDAKRNPDKPTTGWVVDKDSPDQIAEAVKDILAHPEKVKEVTATAHKLALEKYNWDPIAKDVREKVFDRVLK